MGSISTSWTTTSVANFLANTATYRLISGTQPDFHRVSRARPGHMGERTAPLAGPTRDTHLEGVREAKLRAAAYHRLRLHGSFVNGGNWAFPVLWESRLSSAWDIYGPLSDVRFLQASLLYGAAVFAESLEHDGSGDLPRIKYQRHWDLRPHSERIIQVDEERLALWRDSLDRPDEPLDETPLVHAVTTAELRAMVKLAAYHARLGDRDPRISSGYHEKGARDKGLIRESVSAPCDWSEVILQGPHFFVATPFAKQPPDMGRQSKVCDLTKLTVNAVPTTKYVRACEVERYRAEQDHWLDDNPLRPSPGPTPSSIVSRGVGRLRITVSVASSRC